MDKEKENLIIDTNTKPKDDVATRLSVGDALMLATVGADPLVESARDYDCASTAHEISESEAEMLAEKRQAHVAELSPLRIVVKRFMRSKLSMIGVGLLVFLLLFSFLGPVVYSKWGETEVDRTLGKVDTVESQIVYYDKDGNAHTIYQVTEQDRDFNYWADPGGRHPFGTDRQGRDVLTRLMYGGRISLLIALSVIVLQTIIGIILGGLAGYFGKWVDQLIMRIVEVFICVPSLPLLIIIGAITSDPSVSFSANAKIMVLIAVMIFFGWANIARIVRGQILALREQEYMIAAETMGFGSARRIFKHLVPNIMPVLLVTMTLGFGSIILSEAGLSFLGFGVPQPLASWGGMLSSITLYGTRVFFANNALLWVAPGLMILMSVLAFNFIGDGLRDAMDPKSRR